MAKDGLYDFCISTIVERRKLEDFALRGSGTFTEERKWITGVKLWEDADSRKLKLPVILSDAAYNSEPLLLWGIVKNLKIDRDQTAIQLGEIQRVRGKYGRSDLKLRTTGELIKQHFIRPYAVCHTPPFLK